MKSSTFAAAAGIALFIAASAVSITAHHSFAAEYDSTKSIKVTGEVVRLEWTNPHARVVVNGPDENGVKKDWDFELGPPTTLMRRGWNRNSLKPGNVITVEGFRSKDEPSTANARTVKLSDGRQVFAGSSFDTQTPSVTP
jgi:hypothetical protein